MKPYVLPTGMIQTNCVILAQDDGSALVIDPGADPERIQSLLAQHHLRVVGYPLTHGHYDHVCALADMVEALPAPCWMHPKDLAWAFSAINQYPPHYRQPAPSRVPAVLPAWENDGPFSAGSFHFDTLHLPGHSPGSVAFYFPAQHLLIGGDVLFKGSVGRTDLPGGNTATLFRSLRRLSTLPPETIVLSGHGPATRIGDELRGNPFMREALRETD